MCSVLIILIELKYIISVPLIGQGHCPRGFNFCGFFTAANTNEKNTQTNLLSFIQNEKYSVQGCKILL